MRLSKLWKALKMAKITVGEFNFKLLWQKITLDGSGALKKLTKTGRNMAEVRPLLFWKFLSKKENILGKAGN